ncbi:hypothetical protein [Flavobacterium pectinovorum]|uniref:Peptidase U49 n=1 Tax=Flavobacterium pectinovorum TaxID=29533 RepID=A0A502EL94_9FLAO|nr:hypothetical protein [Flavobacterium pectinovorum]TPG37752.1 hypothetical protein EAH81_17625 [Flavobacterium pectinovorum]
MNRSLYNENSENILRNTAISKSDIFNIIGNPIEDIFLTYFEFCTNDLELNSSKFGLENSYFFYWDKEDVNSGGTYNNGSYIMYVSKEQIIKLNEKLNENKFFTNYRLKRYFSLSQCIDLEYLMFQTSIIFTYYHEFAHLVQKREGQFDNQISNISNLISYNHISEYDSDLNGCQFVCLKIIDLCELKSINSNDDVFKLLAVGLSGILITILLFYKKEFKTDTEIEPFYLNEGTHPHHIVKISYILEHYHEIAKANHIDFKIVDLLKEAFEISAIYFDNPKFFTDYLDLYQEQIPQINNYIGEIYDEAIKLKSLMMQNYSKYDL